jgi:adenosylcobinamide-GDP ribazoletransferase
MRLLAALTFFTRLPFWRIREIPAEAFKRVVPLWPLVGWLTGFVTAAVLWLCSNVMPLTLAWIAALVARLLLTGCLHEDGLADFIDGFGGGNTRERTLAIMKDSHIGTYGVIGLIVYFALMLQLPATLSRDTLCIVVLAGDCWAKCCAAQLTNLLPYARNAEEAKNKTVYSRMKWHELLLCLAFGIAPAAVMTFWLGWMPFAFFWQLGIPAIVMLLLAGLMKRRIAGYTGDCCGATFLLCELSYYIAILLNVTI